MSRRRSPSNRRRGWVGALGWLLLLIGSLAFVSWRQPIGLAMERTVRELDTQSAMSEAERVELTRRIEYLRSRARIVQVARDRLGMHFPVDNEIILLPVAAELEGVEP